MNHVSTSGYMAKKASLERERGRERTNIQISKVGQEERIRTTRAYF
jgi:hypothetical protein